MTGLIFPASSSSRNASMSALLNFATKKTALRLPSIAARRTVDQDLLPRLELSLVAQTLERGERRRRHGRRLFERQVSRLQCDGASASAGVLRECAALRAEHLVTR